MALSCGVSSIKHSPNASNDMSNMSDLSVLAHLRHLLAEAPELKSIGLAGGLDTWLFRNTQKVLEWAGSARDDWQTRDVGQIHRHLVRILQYLDGISLSQRDTFGEPVLVSRTIAKIGLLNIDSAQRESSYLYLIDFHLNAMIQSKGLTPNQRQLSIQIDRGVKNVQIWLEQMRQDAKQLVKASGQQLLQPSSLSILDDMTNQALNAFVGRINPATGKIQDGVLQVHFNNQLLATFDPSCASTCPAISRDGSANSTASRLPGLHPGFHRLLHL